MKRTKVSSHVWLIVDVTISLHKKRVLGTDICHKTDICVVSIAYIYIYIHVKTHIVYIYIYMYIHKYIYIYILYVYM